MVSGLTTLALGLGLLTAGLVTPASAAPAAVPPQCQATANVAPGPNAYYVIATGAGKGRCVFVERD